MIDCGVDTIFGYPGGAVLPLYDALYAEPSLRHVLVRRGARPRTRENRSHIYVLDLPVAEWSEYFAQNQVRVSPERDGIRISFAMFNSIEEIEQLAEII